MGYRSEVALSLSPEAQIGMTVRNNMPEILKTADDVTDLGDGKKLYQWYDIKWYGSYKDVQEMENWMRDEPTENFGFIRIGEEHEDIEVFGDYYKNGIYVNVFIGIG